MTEIQKSRRSRGFKSMSVAVAASASVIGLVLGTGTASAAVDGQVNVVDADGNTITLTLSDTFINGVPSLDGNPLTREWFGNGKASWDVQGPSADDFEGSLVLGYQIGYPMSIGGAVTVKWASPTLGLDIGSGNTSTGTLGAGAQIAPATIQVPNPAFSVDAANAAALAGVPYNVPATLTEPNPNAGSLVPTAPSLDIEGVGKATSGIGFHADLLPQATGTLALEPGPGVVQSESGALPVNDGVTGSSNEGSGTAGSVQVAGTHGTVTGVLGNVSVRPYAALTSSTGDIAVAYGPTVRFN